MEHPINTPPTNRDLGHALDDVSEQAIKHHVMRWLDQFVIDLDLCPFARKARVANRIRLVVVQGSSEESLLQSLTDELAFLEAHSDIETTLLIHPQILTKFERYNQFLDAADAVLDALTLRGIYQIASFHPRYQFADTSPEDVENFTNRSPYPMLHLLRESSVERAVENHPDVEQIPLDNIQRLNQLGEDHVLQLMKTINGTGDQ